MTHQVNRGLLKPTGDDEYGPTLRLALRGVRSFFNPFEEGLDLWKLAAVLLGGITLPPPCRQDSRSVLKAHFTESRR